MKDIPVEDIAKELAKPGEDDKIKIGVYISEGNVILAFNKPITFLSMDPKQARQIAESLRKCSHEIK